MTELWEFEKFDKIPRLRRGLVITEKIDGTNAQISIMERHGPHPASDPLAQRDIVEASDAMGFNLPFMSITKDGVDYVILAGSRKRWLTSDKQGDNYGFGKWVSNNREELLGLDVGRHYGEWWGQGIQRRYDMDRKVFSLFNTGRWNANNPQPSCCSVVPVLDTTDTFDHTAINLALVQLQHYGSVAAPGYKATPGQSDTGPEGIVIYMTQARRLFKITIDNDGVPKSLPKPKKATTLLKTSEEWLRDYPVTILDPDGWGRANYVWSFHVERITLAEFKYRVNMSTIEGPWEFGPTRELK